MELKLSLPEDASLNLGATPEQCSVEIRLAAAMKLFELGRMSSGAAAQLAGISRVLFMSRLADYGVDTFRLSEAELSADAASA